MASEWKTMPIKDLYEGLYDGPHATPKLSDSGPVFLGIKNVTDDGRLDLTEIRHIAEDDYAAWTRRVQPRENDLVFTYEATLNRYAIVPAGFRGCLGRRMALIRTDPQKVDVRFLLYYFFTAEWRAVIRRNMLTGATVDRIPLTTFPDFPVRVPTLPIQRRIAGILSAYDELIENSQRRIRILETMARALYREWFVHFRFPGHESVPRVPSPLGEIPKGWEVRRLGEILELNYGKALKKEDRHDGPYPVYGSSGIVGTHDASLVKGPGIIVGRKGNVGSVFWCDDDFFVIDTAYFVTSALPLRFLFYVLPTLNFINSDAAVPGLSRHQAYSLELPVPPADLLAKFCDVADSIERHAIKLQRQIKTLRRTRDLLLPRLLSGQIAVEAD
ncbi:MAG: restriction endonuclease subunit S [Burkholderiaceae bacterium]|jgi:type I restriction enzyme S subunit